MNGVNFDIAHLLAGTLVLVSFLELYQDRLYALLNIYALHAAFALSVVLLGLLMMVTRRRWCWRPRSLGKRSSKARPISARRSCDGLDRAGCSRRRIRSGAARCRIRLSAVRLRNQDRPCA